MYHRVREEVFDGILTAALEEFIYEADKSLPSDAELAVMYPISKKARRRYKRLAKARKYGTALPIVYLRRAAVVVLILSALSFGILATDSNVRAAVADAVVTWYEQYIEIDFGHSSDTNGNTEADFNSLNIGYIPAGFELTDAKEENHLREYMYIKDDGDYMVIGIYTSDTTNVSVDIEDMEYEVMTINNNDAHLVYNQEERTGVFTIGNSNYTILITAILDKAELIKVAENIK